MASAFLHVHAGTCCIVWCEPRPLVRPPAKRESPSGSPRFRRADRGSEANDTNLEIQTKTFRIRKRLCDFGGAKKLEKMTAFNVDSGAPQRQRSLCDGSRLSRVSGQTLTTRLHRSVRQFSTPRNTPARQCCPTVRVFDHGSQIATEMIGHLTTPFMDGSNDVTEIFSRRAGCHRSCVLAALIGPPSLRENLASCCDHLGRPTHPQTAHDRSFNPDARHANQTT